MADWNPRKRNNLDIVLAAVLFLLTIVIITVVLAFTVYKPKHPIPSINSLTIEDASFSVDVFRFQVLLNLTIGANVSIYNPNNFDLRYHPTKMHLSYRNKNIGEAPINGGEILARETEPVNVTVSIMADKVLSTRDLFTDVMKGELPLNTELNVAGEAVVMKVFKIHVDSSKSCDFTVFLSNRTVGPQECSYLTKW